MHDFYPSASNISLIKPRKMRSVTPDTHGEEKHLGFLSGNLTKRGHLEDQGVQCNIRSLRNRIEGHGLDFHVAW
jgi:hypothetical protein